MPTLPPDPWLGVEPRHLATFTAVAETGSFRGAAARLGYVQSAVSQQIAQLERALDTQLIERGQGNRDLVLTSAGRTLLGHARRIVDQVRAACADVAYLARERPVRVAVEPAAMPLLGGLTHRLAGVHAAVGLAVAEVPAAEQPELVALGSVDVGLGCFADLRPGLRHHLVDEDQWVLVVPDDAPLAAERRVTSPTALHGMPIIEERSHPLPVDAGQIGADRVISCDRLPIALDLVRAGAGSAILPRLGVPADEPGVAVVALGDRLPPRAVSLIWLEARRLPAELDQLGGLGLPAASEGEPLLAAAA